MAASAVRSVFSSANLRCCLYTPSERREQQLRLAWERVVQQQAGSLHRQWRRQREEAAALAAEAASQVAQIEQMKLVIREKEQKERYANVLLLQFQLSLHLTAVAPPPCVA